MRVFRFGFLLVPLLAFSPLARADFQTDLKAPLALLDQNKFVPAVQSLQAMTARYPDEFLLYYLLGAAQLNLLDKEADNATNIKIAQESRASLLRAQKLAGTNTENRDLVTEPIKAAEDLLRALNAPLDVPAATDKDAEIAALKAKLAALEASKKTPAPAQAPAKIGVNAVKPVGNLQLPKLAPRAGYIIGRCIDMRGKPLAGVGVRVFGTTQKGGETTSFETKTDATGKYAVKLPAGNFHVGWAHYFTDAPSGPPYALPLHPLDGSNDDQNSTPGIVEDLVLKINGRISPKNDPDSDLSYYGGFITVEGGTLENGNFLDGYNYKFPAGSSVELTLTPSGKLADGSTGQILTLRRPIERGYLAEFRDVPLGAYSLTARLVSADGTIRLLRIAAAKFFSGTSPTARPVELADFGDKASIYFPSRGDSIPLLRYGGAAKAVLYVKP